MRLMQAEVFSNAGYGARYDITCKFYVAGPVLPGCPGLMQR
jgi:hypothetical protein